MIEAEIVRQIIAFIKSEGGDAYKVHGSAVQRKGEPDITGEIIINGVTHHIKCEVKTPTGVLSEIQEYRIKHYADMGYFASVVISLAEFKAELLKFHLKYVRANGRSKDERYSDVVGTSENNAGVSIIFP